MTPGERFPFADSTLDGGTFGVRADGELLYANDSVGVTCVAWNADSTLLAYQDVTRIYVWGTTRLLYIDDCAIGWVKDARH